MTLLPNSPEARDAAYHLHSYTNARRNAADGPMVVGSGEGIYVNDIHGGRYIEAMAGLWSVGLGFSETRLIDAAVKQMQTLPYYHNFSQRSHGPVIDLAEKLVAMAPVPMSKVFFTNSGSEANDTILKLIWYRSNALDQPLKKKVISRQRGYHGVTLAAASMTGLPNNHRSFDIPLPNILHTMCPHFAKEGLPGESEVDFATRCADELRRLIEKEGPDTIAAFIAEPVMGAGGVVVPPQTYWEKIQAVLQEHDILLIADEVICGFGRTGSMFGSQTFDIKPDIMTLSKQITSSYFPFSAILLNERTFEPIADESNKIGVLGHGYTGGAHPVGAAIALETIRIIEEENLVENSRERGEELLSGLRRFEDHPLVSEVRGRGLLAAIELAPKAGDADGYQAGQLGVRMNQIMMENGVISRNMIDAMAFCPPLIISSEQIADLLARVEKSLEQLSSS